MKKARIYSNMPTTLLNGILGEKKLFQKRKKRINQFFFRLGIQPVIGVM